MPWFNSVRRPGTARAQPSPRGKRGLMGTNRTTHPSSASPRRSATAWTAWPPRMSGLVATRATRRGLDRMLFRNGEGGRSVPGPGRRRAGEESPAPPLERQHRPELQPEVAVARPAEQAVEGGPLENVPGEAVRREQQVAREAAQGPLEPAAQGNCEAALRPLQDRLGHEAAQGALEQVFGGAAAKPVLEWQGSRELHQAVVEQGHPYLERVGHAHAIDLREHVEGQIAGQVQVLKGGQPVALPAGQQAPLLAPGIVARQQVPQLGPQEIVALRRPEQGERVQVAILVWPGDVTCLAT